MVGGGGGAADLAGEAGYYAVGGDDGVFGDQGSGGDDGVVADVGSVEDDGSDADEDVVFDGAAVDGGVVADADSAADDDRVEVAHAVEDGVVLDVGSGGDADVVDVAADDGVGPEGGLGAEVDVADELGGGVDVAAGGDGGGEAAVGADHADKYRDGCGGTEMGSKWAVGAGGCTNIGQSGRFLYAKGRVEGICLIDSRIGRLGGVFILAEVRVQEGEPLENALRRFKRKVQTEDIIKEVKRHSFYLKPGEKKRVKEALARKRNRKKVRKEQD